MDVSKISRTVDNIYKAVTIVSRSVKRIYVVVKSIKFKTILPIKSVFEFVFNCG